MAKVDKFYHIKRYTVYTLADPRNPNEPIYVGMTSNIHQRMSVHRTPGGIPMARGVYRRWREELAAAGLKPMAYTTAFVYSCRRQAAEKEMSLIAEYDKMYKLVNTVGTSRQKNRSAREYECSKDLGSSHCCKTCTYGLDEEAVDAAKMRKLLDSMTSTSYFTKKRLPKVNRKIAK